MALYLLHVDDSEDEVFLFRRAFEKSGIQGWELESAEGGESALQYLASVKSGKRPKPDLILIDLKMPIVSGFEVLEWLGTNDLKIPAAILSSSELPADREKAIELGARDYIAKRGTFVDVLEFVRNWQTGTC